MLPWGGSTTSYSYMEDGKGFQTKQDQLKIAPYNKEKTCQGAGIMKDSIDELTEPIHLSGFPPKSLPSNSIGEESRTFRFFCDTLVGVGKSRGHSCETPLFPWAHDGLGPSRGQALTVRVSVRCVFPLMGISFHILYVSVGFSTREAILIDI